MFYRITVIEDDNERLQNQLDSLRAARAERERKAKEINDPQPRVVKKDHRPIPGQKSTNKV